MKKKKKHKGRNPAEQDKASEATLFVCVRDRGAQGASCAGRGSRELTASMRAMLAAEGIVEQELSVRPCGCLGLCRKGPAAVLATGEAARSNKPPKSKASSDRHLVFRKMEPQETRDILREALLKVAQWEQQ